MPQLPVPQAIELQSEPPPPCPLPDPLVDDDVPLLQTQSPSTQSPPNAQSDAHFPGLQAHVQLLPWQAPSRPVPQAVCAHATGSQVTQLHVCPTH
jgi:hypothetical protein